MTPEAGERTTIELPAELARKIRELAPLLGTTPSDVIVFLAEEGALLHEPELELARQEEARLQAILEACRIPP